MEMSKIHPELRKVVRCVPPLPFHNRFFVRSLNFLKKIVPENKVTPGVVVSRSELTQSSVRIYRPTTKTSGAGLLWVHGGGLISGRAIQDDQLCAAYVKDLNLVVVSVDYRLAPNDSFPAPLNDCYEAWQWFLSEAKGLNVDPERIVVSGRSAGGGLAASLVQRLLDDGGVQPAGQALMCPMLDDRTAANHQLDSINHRIWNNRSNRAGWSAYLQNPPGVAEVPEYAVPARRQNLSGLPPAWLGVGDIDLFFEENRLYYERMKESGVECEMHVAPMAPHGFEGLAPKASISQDLFRSNYMFLRKSLHL